MKSILDYLQLYRDLDFCVIPALPHSKRPAVDWMEYQTRQPSDKEYEEWTRKYWSRTQPYNLGVVCGRVSDGLVNLDFESVEAYQKFFPKHQELEENTMTVKTARGVHVYLRSADTEPIMSFKIPQLEMEVRSEGCFVVLPPSIHPSGVQYILHPLFFSDPKIITVDDLLEALWRRIEDLGVKKPRDYLSEALLERLQNRKAYRGPDPPCIRRLLEGFKEGWRNEAAMRLASYWLNTRKLKMESAWERLREWNRKNRPPLDERELRACLEHVAKYGYHYGCRGMIQFCDKTECKFAREKGNIDILAQKPIEYI